MTHLMNSYPLLRADDVLAVAKHALGFQLSLDVLMYSCIFFMFYVPESVCSVSLAARQISHFLRFPESPLEWIKLNLCFFLSVLDILVSICFPNVCFVLTCLNVFLTVPRCPVEAVWRGPVGVNQVKRRQREPQFWRRSHMTAEWCL